MEPGVAEGEFRRRDASHHAPVSVKLEFYDILISRSYAPATRGLCHVSFMQPARP
jgi:hypothetical protein